MGGGLEDRTTSPVLPPSALEVVVDLDYPPGNIAVSADGRIFFTLHPDGNPPAKVLELVDGKPTPYPNDAFQQPQPGTPHFQSPLSLRVDRQGRLWVLDYADYGRGQPRLLAFDLKTNAVVHQYDFPSEVAGFLSMLNDFQVDPEGQKIYIAETSPILQRPALIVYDVTRKTSRRLLDGHPSLATQDYVIQAPGRDMIIYGLFTLRIARRLDRPRHARRVALLRPGHRRSAVSRAHARSERRLARAGRPWPRASRTSPPRR